ncbi:MAG TPA: hypothetical protein VFC44_07400, partial [Candidatus Saccharimonadales bacterium]|nr:hypothetical protein [Candidatus Saccharimonadales bacterium]
MSSKVFAGRLVFAGQIFSLLFSSLSARAEGTPSSPREKLLMDFGWRFHLGDEWGFSDRLDKAGVNPGPAARSFGDAAWRVVDLPHDWAIELPFDSRADTSHGFKPVGPHFHTNDVGWYRRGFTLPETDKGRRLWLQ